MGTHSLHTGGTAYGIPDDLRGDAVRAGHRLLDAVEPHAGERVRLTARAGGQFRDPAWFYVQKVEGAYQPGWLYVIGCFVATGRGSREYVRLAGLRVERALPARR
ncbi:MAG: hypothetical protein WCA46_08900 [Actinocatenispora sp.]